MSFQFVPDNMNGADINTIPVGQHSCPTLGHEIRFGCLREPGRQTRCGILDCWWRPFDVKNLSPGTTLTRRSRR